MPRVIVKCRYYSPKSRKDIGGMLTYIATREGVEKPIEKTYLDYMATRPRAERISGSHGLFSQSDKEIDLATASKDVSAFNGNIFTVIISVSRNDAERLGFNNANRWRDMIRAKISDVAKAHDIPLEDLEWYGAFHNESHHPHVHLLLYSRNENYPGFIKRKNIDDLRRTFAKAIFADDLHNLYDEQTERRNTLSRESIDEFNELCTKIEQGLCTNEKLVKMVRELSERLKTVKGKKQYGYLPKSVKAMVDEIVDELSEDERIKRLYELWYESKCQIFQTYTDIPPPMLPLSMEKEFKPIRNAVIRCAAEMAVEDNTFSPQIITQVARLGKDIEDTFQDRFNRLLEGHDIAVDSKLKREIEAKKMGVRMSF